MKGRNNGRTMNVYS